MRFSKGKEYKITFLDHTADSSDPLEFNIYGRCMKSTRTSVTIGVWVYSDESNFDDNEKFYSILRSTIQKAKEI